MSIAPQVTPDPPGEDFRVGEYRADYSLPTAEELAQPVPVPPKINRVIVTIRPPKPEIGDVGQVAEGFYIHEGDTITMTDAFGVVMKRDDGTVFERKIPDCTPQVVIAIARQMTKEVRRFLRGETEAQEKFRQKISYSKAGVV